MSVPSAIAPVGVAVLSLGCTVIDEWLCERWYAISLAHEAQRSLGAENGGGEEQVLDARGLGMGPCCVSPIASYVGVQLC